MDQHTQEEILTLQPVGRAGFAIRRRWSLWMETGTSGEDGDKISSGSQDYYGCIGRCRRCSGEKGSGVLETF